ncbi:SRPBCC family protein [Salinilacihabitans rarus]|uniref:SRPBCC family protein n=1 Tax=Salinilacihabitans rarus TaxID=2961596 RepID=UPI0020C83E1B|nr:SRPBCC family protein [Salinilacihabitans rarus]
MPTVTVSRTIDASPDAVRDGLADVESLLDGAGFDEVAVDGREVRVTKRLGPKTIRLTLDVDADAAAALAYDQREGVFDAMRTEYVVEGADGDSGDDDDDERVEVTATTTFEGGPFGAATGAASVIRRQRGQELDSLAAAVEG